MKRIPLWLTLVPLVVGVTGYWWFWTGWKHDFHVEIAKIQPGKAVSIGGFPYRMEARIKAPGWARPGDGTRPPANNEVSYTIRADDAVLNRGPWQRDLTIIRSARPVFRASVPALAGAMVDIQAPSAESSLHLDKDRRIVRLSTVFDRPVVKLGIMPGLPLAATKLEVHFRETPGRSVEAWSPTLPERAQVVLAGQGIRTATGAPLTLAADIRLTGQTRLVDYARWAVSGTVEIHDLTLADATGEVLRLNATVVPAGSAARLSGTIVTACPASVSAALTGTVVSEQRLRLPVTLTLGGSPGAWTLGPLPAGTRAVRAQQPACPRLR